MVIEQRLGSYQIRGSCGALGAFMHARSTFAAGLSGTA
jgi:hypothetical protein